MDEGFEKYAKHKTIPDNIRKPCLIALSHYPELIEVPIDFKYVALTNVTMQARPEWRTLFGHHSRRRYGIYISENSEVEKGISIQHLPEDVMIGWVGHELGHIMDYQTMGSRQLIRFGAKYVSSKKFIRKAELIADTYAVQHGLGEYILKTKQFLIENPHSTERYRAKIKRLYPEATVIRQLMKEVSIDLN